MSDRPPVSTSENPTPPGKKPRSPVERVIVWGGIAILLGVLAFEARQKYSYDPTVSRLRKALTEDTEKYMKLSEVRQMIAGSPTWEQTPHDRRAYHRINLKWPSLFKDYRVELIVESEGTDPLVAGFSTPGGTDPEPVARVNPSPETSAAAAASASPMGMPMGGMGGGGQGRPGAAGRPGGAGMGGGPAAGMGGGPGGGMGGGPQRGRGVIAMAQRAEVVAELKLTDEQVAKLAELQAGSRAGFQSAQALPESERAEALKTLREEQEKSVGELLDEPQFNRLRQLVWREAGLTAVERDDVAKALGLSDEQREKLRPLLADRQSAMREYFAAPPEILEKKRKEWDDLLRAALTDEQVKQWEELLGPPAPTPAPANAPLN